MPNDIRAEFNTAEFKTPAAQGRAVKTKLKKIKTEARAACTAIDPTDEEAVAGFLVVAEEHVLGYYSRAKQYRPLWLAEMLGLGCWLSAVFDVLHPKGEFRDWFEEKCEPYFTYQTGRNWRRLWEYLTAGHLELKPGFPR